MQADTTTAQIFSGEQSKAGKGLELIFAIAGWPIVYSLQKSTYTLAGDLAQFTTIQPWASAPKLAASEVKDRPEAGGFTIGQLDIEILDKSASPSIAGQGGHITGQRYGLTDLVSRQAYLQGNTSGGNIHTLAADLSTSATSLTLDSASGLASSGVVYIGQECIAYASIAGAVLNGCTRGYRKTQATRHLGSGSTVAIGFPRNGVTYPPFGRAQVGTHPGVKVYDFVPSLIRRPCYVYKGFTSMTSTAQFLPAWGGVLMQNPVKKGPSVTFTAMGTTWETYLRGQEKLAELVTSTGAPWSVAVQGFGSIGKATGGPGEFAINLVVPEVGNWANAPATHYALKFGSTWVGVSAAQVIS